VAVPAGLQHVQQVVSLGFPTKSKQTQMIAGSASEAAKELVRRLREEARAL
jgi:electron transfer flavoprotein alpha/beta subunit